MRATLLLALACVALFASGSAVERHRTCPAVYDGADDSTNPWQTSTTSVSAHWDSLTGDVKRVEWGVASRQLLERDNYALGPKSCVRYESNPDMLMWRDAGASNIASITGLDLSVGESYYVLLRIQYMDGTSVVTRSNGFVVVEQQLATSPETTKFTHPSSIHGDLNIVTRRRAKREVSAAPVVAVGGTCPIVEANRCRQSRKTVGDLLRERYGPPVYAEFDPNEDPYSRDGPIPIEDILRMERQAARDEVRKIRESEASGDDDDDGGHPAWILAPVLSGVFLVACLILICFVVGAIVATAFSRKRGGRARTGKRVYGKRGTGGGSNFDGNSGGNDARVEYPDTDIS